ncbi:histidine kinase [Paenibacillus sp. LHD-38]|uniref:cache domain-containing sensor histidine kinase n=1 Tax=Paenibacillus sp. LHD-38 TaxID=3072143 RepID=UPI00280D7A19|nr:histidine kinase [Paenibacillus sp. LHD-38]MDQ8735607.1 histidine kinase [Paenibacillus sp. LHD-38]
MAHRSIRKRIGAWKLRNKLMISYFVASIVPIIVISITVYQISSKSVEEASQEFASLYISQATTNLDLFLDQHDKSTRSVLLERDIMKILGSETPFSMDQTIENKKVLQRFFGRLSEVYPEIESIMLVDVRGDIHHFTKAADTVNTSVLQEQHWYGSIRESEHSMFVTAVHDKSYYNHDKGGAAFTVGRVLWDYDGSYAGMILFDMDPSNLIQLSKDFLSIGNRYDIRLMITGNHHQLIYHSDAATGKIPWKQVIGAAYRSESAGSNSDTIVLSHEAGGGGFLISAEIPLDKLLARIKSIEHVTIWAIIVSLLFIIIISTLFSYRITRPILELRRSMKQVELGQYSVLSPVPSANDEISGLIKSYNNMIQKNKELIEDVYIAGIKRKQAQFLALQAQINPHMLYNTLESIRMKAVVKSQDDIAEMIKRLARMFKHSLGMQVEHNRVRNEVEYAANYLYLQNIRYDNRFTLEVNLSDQVLDTQIIPISFQPIVENCIKHGFQDYSKSLIIKIEESRIPPNDVLIRIVDNGKVLSDEKMRKINAILQQDVDAGANAIVDLDTIQGIGLRNIAERIKMQYGERYYIKIGSEGTGTYVELLIPLQ